MSLGIALSLAAVAASPADRVAPPGLAAFVQRTLKASRYRWAEADLDGDGRPEALVYVTDPGSCGSGGCDLYVLATDAGSYRIVTDLSVTRLPVRVLSSATNGWRDIAVRVAGGGILPGYDARLRFDGRGYPANPTVAPATRIDHPGGRVAIAP